MVGYPIALWDSVNNYPIFRKDITATSPANKYDGRDEFTIDAACWPGSSGPPVFLYNMGNYVDKEGNTVIGNRFYLLGILFAGPVYKDRGQIKIVNIPDRADTQAVTYIPINLWVVIRASRLLGLEPIIAQLFRRSN